VTKGGVCPAGGWLKGRFYWADRAYREEWHEPSGDDYAKGPRHKLGLSVPLPAPLGFELDTAEF
jgi:hypothetical protein